MDAYEEIDTSVSDRLLRPVRILVHRSRKVAICIAIALFIAVAECFRHAIMAAQHIDAAQPLGAECRDIPVPPGYWGLRAQETTAFVDIPNTNAIEAGGTVCVRVIVPARPSAAPESFTPLPGSAWDSILLDMVGNSTGISIPVHLRQVQYRGRDAAHVYEADVRLRDMDVYRPRGYIEFRDARWNPDGILDPQPFAPEQLEIPEHGQIHVSSQEIRSLETYMDMPLCTRADAEGRWVAVADIPFDVTDQMLPLDNRNRVWMPYDCRMRTVSYREYAQCLADRYPVVHWFGDSNTRRALKKVTSLGQWCSTAEDIQSTVCACNDNVEQYARYNSNARVVPIDMDVQGGGVEAASGYLGGPVPGNKSRIVAFKWDGLTDRNQPAWSDPFDRPDGIPAHSSEMPPVAAVIIGVVNWDTAFSTRAFFAGQVQRLVEKVRKSYPESTEIIIRTGQYYCCTSDTDKFWKRRYSRLRNSHYSSYIVDQFRDHLGPHRVRIWDVASLAERRPYSARDAEINLCPANHVRSELVDIENQLLMNAMCN
ncbi:hypothetical protein LPJ59_000195 [Coemansia sp. RSA 2399]|nr:hypothetical protein LPJ59_000195 [Coemansia sp. RSA 2399]KAJ1908325.1 hypothetical protein LPJ81_000185 [Coemansia sp. IMI 209127]